MRRTATFSITLLTLLAIGCGSRSGGATSQPTTPQAPVSGMPTERPKLLTVDRNRPTTAAWKEVDGKRVDVLPGLSFTTARISGPIRATADHSLVGEVAVLPDGNLWSTSGGLNTSVPVVTAIGKVGAPTSWRRLRVDITHIVIRDQDGSFRSVPAKGWLVDADDEIGGVRCTLEQPDFTSGQKVEPTVQVPEGHRVVIVLSETVVL